MGTGPVGGPRPKPRSGGGPGPGGGPAPGGGSGPRPRSCPSVRGCVRNQELPVLRQLARESQWMMHRCNKHTYRPAPKTGWRADPFSGCPWKIICCYINGYQKQYILVDIMFNNIFHVGLPGKLFKKRVQKYTFGALAPSAPKRRVSRTQVKTFSWSPK